MVAADEQPSYDTSIADRHPPAIVYPNHVGLQASGAGVLKRIRTSAPPRRAGIALGKAWEGAQREQH